MRHCFSTKRTLERKWNLKHVIQNSPGSLWESIICCCYTSNKILKDFSQVEKDHDTLSKYSPKVPPAPSARANTSPLIDMFNNPATGAQNSGKIFLLKYLFKFLKYFGKCKAEINKHVW